MQINFLNQPCFNGKTKFLSCDSDGKHKKITENHFGSMYFGDTRGLQSFIKRLSYPNASVEESIGKFHDNKTFRIYIADPKEIVDDSLKLSHDYIVYDIEPDFPDIKQRFLSFEYEELDKEFKTIYDYYVRMEKTAKNEANKKIAEKQKTLVQTCIEIFNESKDIRKEKEKLTNNIETKTYLIESIKETLKKYSYKLAIKKETIPKHRHILSVKEDKLHYYIDKKSCLESKTKTNPEKIKILNANIKTLSDSIETFKIKLRKFETNITVWEEYINDAPNRIREYTKNIHDMNIRMNEIEQKIKSNFEKLHQFYITNSIKICKRI